MIFDSISSGGGAGKLMMSVGIGMFNPRGVRNVKIPADEPGSLLVSRPVPGCGGHDLQAVLHPDGRLQVRVMGPGGSIRDVGELREDGTLQQSRGAGLVVPRLPGSRTWAVLAREVVVAAESLGAEPPPLEEVQSDVYWGSFVTDACDFASIGRVLLS